tara:strand:- start:9012 stop:9146 length:135 start_codon:yes stop_codon:yes gene_type:complete
MQGFSSRIERNKSNRQAVKKPLQINLLSNMTTPIILMNWHNRKT